MPHLRFNRDKRGYENTVVVHSDRRKGRSPRILYLFRTPPGVKVGRAALDEDAIRLLEAHNPEVEFDWPRILDGERRPQAKAAPADVPPRPKSDPPSRPRKERGAAPPPQRQGERPPIDAAEPLPEPTAAGARLGAEGLARLRIRHSELLARISERVEDSDRQAELKALADRLNPDGWVTDAEVLAALDGYEVTFESLRTAIGPRRRPGKPAPQAE